MKKRTLKKKFSIEGIGIHTGEKCRITLYPKKEDGIIFLKENIEIPLSLDYVLDTDHGTNIGKDGIEIRTVEHLTSAIFGLSIDNLLIEVKGPEIPILDGSCKAFCKEILKNGIIELKEEKKFVKIKGFLSLEEEGKYIAVKPSRNFKVTTIISYKHPSLFFDIFEFNESLSYIEELAKARTFGVLKWKEELTKKGLIKGATTNNILIFDEEKNISRRRFKNEVVRHKCLDFLGDLSLFAINIKGEFLIFRTGHSLHYKFFKLLKEREELWSIT